MTASPPTAGQQRITLRARLAALGVDAPALEADWILEWSTGLDRLQLLTHPERVLRPEELDRIDAALVRRSGFEPLQYILGETGFYGRTFKVAPGVLIPRPETEGLVEAALNWLQSRSQPATVLDIGTGSGCVAVSVKMEAQEVNVLAMDRSSEALIQARENADRLGAEVRFLEVDVFHEAGMRRHFGNGSIDCIVSNPPYIPDDESEDLQPELAHEPAEALFTRGASGRFVDRILEVGLRCLTPDGVVLIELHSTEADYALSEALRCGFAGARVHADLAGLPRVLEARR